MRIRITPSRALFAAIAALGLSSIVNAQSVATAPVGAVSVQVNSGSDRKVGVPLLRPAVFAGAVGSVSSGTLSVASVPALGTEAKFIKFTSGALLGQWFTLTAATGSSISVGENLAALGAAAGDQFEVRPFWTLATLLPSGGGLPSSADVFDPVALVLLNDSQATGINIAASAAYFYHDGSSGFVDAGWVNGDGSLSSANDVIVSPEVSLTYRNGTGAGATIVNVGDVPVKPIANTIIARAAGDQDNLVFNPYPAAISLANSGLASSLAVRPSADVFNPGDQVLVYDANSTGLNPSSSLSYFYHDGSSGFVPAGWVKGDGSLESADSAEIGHGAAIVIRKSGGVSQGAEWTPAVPYTL